MFEVSGPALFCALLGFAGIGVLIGYLLESGRTRNERRAMERRWREWDAEWLASGKTLPDWWEGKWYR